MFYKITIFPCWLLVAMVLVGCGSSQQGFFGTNKTAHEKYADGIKDAGLQRSKMGQLWLDAAAQSIGQPQVVTLPYKETGYFAADKPQAHGYTFTVRRGQQISVSVQLKPVAEKDIFAELWQIADAGSAPKFAAAWDTVAQNIRHEVQQDGRYLLRLQPELLQAVEYTVTIALQPSLAFPVQSSGRPRITSFWGANRDEGTRSHEGIDIVAAFRTPALAATNGTISRVEDTKIGGKVVFLRSASTGLNLYYAHLDSQMVVQGQSVQVGEVIGLVGNTGNASKSVPHLHFGIYDNGGAIDPLAFVEAAKQEPQPVTASLGPLGKWCRLSKASTLYETPSSKATVVAVLPIHQALQAWSATTDWYRVTLPDGRSGYILSKLLDTKPLRSQSVHSASTLYDAPSLQAATKTSLAIGGSVQVFGVNNGFLYVSSGDVEGWIEARR